jgi:hypothetical protein
VVESEKRDNQAIGAVNETALKPADISRKIALWKWLLFPKDNPLPENAQREELIEVFNQNMRALTKFKETTDRVSETLDRFQ